MTHDSNEQIRDLEQQILSIFAEVAFIEISSAELNLIEEGLLDSLVFVDLIMSLQENFQIELSIAELEFEQFQSVGHIARYMDQQLNTKDAEPNSQPAGESREKVREL